MTEYQAMYYEKDPKTGTYFIYRQELDGYMNVAPFQFKTKKAACDYIRAHYLVPRPLKKD